MENSVFFEFCIRVQTKQKFCNRFVGDGFMLHEYVNPRSHVEN